jgi:class 3 adenylate cyclase
LLRDVDATVIVVVGALLVLSGFGAVVAGSVRRRKESRRPPPPPDLVAMVQGAVQAGIRAAPVVKDSIQSMVAWANSRRSSPRTDLAPDGTITLLFSDIENSTVLNGRLGDDEWMKELRAHTKLVQTVVDSHDGHIVKSQGDGFMVAFKQPDRAVACAVALQRALHKQRRGKARLRVRVGIHTGRAISEDGDFFGENVTFAARVAQQAHGGEILASDAVKQAIDARAEHEAGVCFSTARDVELKGIEGTQRVYAIDWRQRTPRR